VSYTNQEGREDILQALADAIDALGRSLAALGEAYELLDEATADRLEEALFQPVQGAFGRAKRTYTGFAERHELTTAPFAPADTRSPASGARALIEDAVAAAAETDMVLGELQDTMLPVEVGDAELREGLSAVRRAVGEVPARSRDFLRILGR
jgi:hypothetical protein